MNESKKLKLKYEESTLPAIRKKLLHAQSCRYRAETTAKIVNRLRALGIETWRITMLREPGSFGDQRLWLALMAAYNGLAIKEDTFDQWLNILENELAKYDHRRTPRPTDTNS